MKRTVVLSVCLFACGISLHSQSNPDYEKLSKACELWGLIRYFHPDSPGSDLDSAFAANVPAMLKAHSEEEWRTVLTQWLTTLNDPDTYLVTQDPQDAPAEILSAEFQDDHVLVIKISGYTMFDDYYKMMDFVREVGQKISASGKEIIFDLRQSPPLPENYRGYLGFYFDGLNSALSTADVPRLRYKYYSGFKPEADGTSGGYTINEVLRSHVEQGSFEKANRKVAWIINEHSELPLVALAQQASGVGSIISTSPDISGRIPLWDTFNFSETLLVRFKTNDLVLPSGFNPTVDYQYSPTEDPVKVARQLFSGEVHPNKKPVSRKSSQVRSGGRYPNETYPAIGYRVLAAAKMFTVIEHFFPYYDLMDNDWRSVLKAALPEFVAAANENEYGLAVAKMYANINDTHGYISGNAALIKLMGEAPPPFVVDLIEDQVVVTQLRSDSVCKTLGIRLGDVILKINGVPVGEIMKKYPPYFAHSTAEPMSQRSAWYSVRGDEGGTGIFTIGDQRGKQRDIRIKWTNDYNKGFMPNYRMDTISMITDGIGYADLTRMEVGQTDEMFERLKNTKAIIFDMRGYPKGTAWSIAPRLSERKNIPLALYRKREVLGPNITSGDVLSSKSYTEFIQTVASSNKWKYKGKTVMLIDHMAVSQSEHTGLFFEQMNNTVFIGSPTAGANGDVTRFEIPGGMILNFSGQGVWHADGRQLQRLGLQPHVVVRPTIKGIRAGKDEVLDKAVEWINANVK